MCAIEQKGMHMLPIKKLRRTRGQTLVEVAASVGTDPGNLSRIERGVQQTSPDLAARLAKHFGYAITEIEILYPERFVEERAA